MIADMMKVDPAINKALREGSALPNEKLQVLHDTTLLILRNRGHLSEEELSRFFDAGYEQKHIMAILLGLAQKVISNYTNHIAKTPVDALFASYA